MDIGFKFSHILFDYFLLFIKIQEPHRPQNKTELVVGAACKNNVFKIKCNFLFLFKRAKISVSLISYIISLFM